MKVALMILAIAKPGMTALEFQLSALILAFRPIRPPAPEPERLPGKPARPDDSAASQDGPANKQRPREQTGASAETTIPAAHGPQGSLKVG